MELREDVAAAEDGGSEEMGCLELVVVRLEVNGGWFYWFSLVEPLFEVLLPLRRFWYMDELAVFELVLLLLRLFEGDILLPKPDMLPVLFYYE